MITAPESRAEALNEISTSIKEYYQNRKDSDQRKKDSERLIHLIKDINNSTLSEEVVIKYIGVELCRLNALNSKILRKANADVLNILINQTSLTYDQLSTALLIGKLYGTKLDLGEKSIEALSKNEKLSYEIEGLLNTNASIGSYSIELESAMYKITLQELQNESEKDPSNLNKLFLYICKFHRWPSCPENASDETKDIILSNNMILKTYLFVEFDKLKPLITDATKNAIIFFLNNYTPKTEDEQKCRITRLQDVIRGYDSITASISKFFNKNVYTLSGDEEIVDAIGKFSRKTTEFTTTDDDTKKDGMELK